MARFGVEHSSLQGLTRLACENNRHGNITMTLSLKHFLGLGFAVPFYSVQDFSS